MQNKNPEKVIVVKDDDNFKVEYIKSNGQIIKDMTSPYLEVAMLLKGKAKIVLQDKEVELIAPTQIMIPPNTIHSCYNLSKSGLWLAIYYKK